MTKTKIDSDRNVSKCVFVWVVFLCCRFFLFFSLVSSFDKNGNWNANLFDLNEGIFCRLCIILKCEGIFKKNNKPWQIFFSVRDKSEIEWMSTIIIKTTTTTKIIQWKRNYAFLVHTQFFLFVQIANHLVFCSRNFKSRKKNWFLIQQ